MGIYVSVLARQVNYSVSYDRQVRGSRLRRLPRGLFKSLRQLRSIDLSKNNLETLHRGVFRDAHKVVSLNLADNSLAQLESDAFKVCRASFLFCLTNSGPDISKIED